MGYWEVEAKAMTSFFDKKNAPANLSKRSGIKYKSMPLFELKDKNMWNARLEKIIPYLPDGAYIAGGFLRAMIAGEDDSNGDIDFFFHTEEAFNKTLDLIRNPSSIPGAEKAFNFYAIPEYEDIKKLRIIDCESLVSFRPNIQLVRLYWFDSPEHVIDSFDFTVCQFITDGKTLWYNPSSFDDLKNKVIKQHRETNDAISILNRVLKYQGKGYNISREDFAVVEEKAIKTLGSSDEMAKVFYMEKLESGIHKRDGNVLQRALDYLETAPASAEAYARLRKKKVEKKKVVHAARVEHNWDGS